MGGRGYCSQVGTRKQRWGENVSEKVAERSLENQGLASQHPVPRDVGASGQAPLIQHVRSWMAPTCVQEASGTSPALSPHHGQNRHPTESSCAAGATAHAHARSMARNAGAGEQLAEGGAQGFGSSPVSEQSGLSLGFPQLEKSGHNTHLTKGAGTVSKRESAL